MHILGLWAEATQEVIGAPSAECIGLFPTYSHYRIVVVVRVVEVELHIHFIVGIGEVIYPAGSVRIHIYDVGVYEIIWP